MSSAPIYDRDPFVPGRSGRYRWCAGCGAKSVAEFCVSRGPPGLYVPRGWQLRSEDAPGGLRERLICQNAVCVRAAGLKFATEHEVSIVVPSQMYGDDSPADFLFIPKAGAGAPVSFTKSAAVAGLRALNAAGDVGPWGRCDANEGKCSCGLVSGRDGNSFLFSVQPTESDVVPRAAWHTNMDVAITARNALPALINVVAAAQPLREPHWRHSAELEPLRVALNALETEWQKICPEAQVLRQASLNAEYQDFMKRLHSFDVTKEEKERETMALVSAPTHADNHAVPTASPQETKEKPSRLAQHVSPLGGAVLDGLALAAVNETGELVLDALRRVAKGNAVVAAALEDPNGRSLALFVAATILHGIAVESPKVLPKAHLVARAAQKQVEASTFLLVHQNAGLVKSLTDELMKVAVKLVEAEELHERLTAGGETPTLDAEHAEQREPVASR